MTLSRLLLLPLLCILFVGCSSDKNTDNPLDDGTNPTASQVYMRCTITGGGFDKKTFTADMQHNVYSTAYNYDESENYSSFTFVNYDMIMTGAFPGRAAGTFPLGDGYYVSLQLNVSQDSPIYIFSDSGSLTIQEIVPNENRLKAKFSGIFSDSQGTTYTLTDGEFLIKKKN